MRDNKLNSVFYAKSYHPIQAGSIDGTDTLPHDSGVYRAFLCSSASLYDPFGDPKAIGGDPYSTVFVGRLSHSTSEHSLHKAMSRYGKVKNLRLVRDIVTGASRGYAFVEFESEREMRRAYMDAHHSFIDNSEIIVDYNRQQLMPGWIPRRLGGGLGGRKESGQLRFGGRERPFRAPLQSIPYDELKRLGISPPPEGRYMSRFEVPSPPRKNRSSIDREEGSSRRRSSIDKEERSHRSSSEEKKEWYSKRISRGKKERSRRSSSIESEELFPHRSSKGKDDQRRRSRSVERKKCSRRSSSIESEERFSHRSSRGKEDQRRRSQSVEREERYSSKTSSRGKEEHSSKWQSEEEEGRNLKRSSFDREKGIEKYNPIDSEENPHQDKLPDVGKHGRNYRDREEGSGKRHRHESRSNRHKKRRSTTHEHSSDL